jgi:putative iron-dependent peroxidase
MSDAQPGILAPVPRLARYLSFMLEPGADPGDALAALACMADGDTLVVGLGRSLVLAVDGDVPGLHDFPVQAGKGIDIPATPASLWCWLRGSDRGDLLHLSRQLEEILLPAFSVEQVIDAFQYRDSRDLTGYEDGTENPKGQGAIDAALVQGRGVGLDGGSFVAVQQWWHELDEFQALSPAEQDDIIGRRKEDNAEFDEAPESAHVKRTAQESFAPQAFMLRRSMPWADGMAAGLVFVAFGKSFDAFEAVLKRMTGAEDGIVDAMFSFTRPVTGAYYWCPPMKGGRLDLSALGL